MFLKRLGCFLGGCVLFGASQLAFAGPLVTIDFDSLGADQPLNGYVEDGFLFTVVSPMVGPLDNMQIQEDIHLTGRAATTDVTGSSDQTFEITHTILGTLFQLNGITLHNHDVDLISIDPGPPPTVVVTPGATVTVELNDNNGNAIDSMLSPSTSDSSSGAFGVFTNKFTISLSPGIGKNDMEAIAFVDNITFKIQQAPQTLLGGPLAALLLAWGAFVGFRSTKSLSTST